MGKFKRFSEIINSENYIFHIHTKYTDGKNSVNDYIVEFPEKALVFTEHIRKIPNYNWREFITEVRKHGHLAGFEAKVLPNGCLDIPEAAIEESDVLAVAVHSYKGENLVSDIRRAFERVSNKIPTVWVHPFSSTVERKLRIDKVEYILTVMNGFEKKVFLEYNVSKKNFTKAELVFLKKKYNIVIGYDAHSVEQLKELISNN